MVFLIVGLNPQPNIKYPDFFDDYKNFMNFGIKN